MSFAVGASVTVPGVKPIAILFPSRILRFLRFFLFQVETNNMPPLFAKADKLSGEVIGAAIEVHRIIGPGLLESIYERCLLREHELRGIPVLNQEEIAIFHEVKLLDGVSRLVLPGANRPSTEGNEGNEA